MRRANTISDMPIRYAIRECDKRIRYGPREYDMLYANRLRTMSNCKVAFSATIRTRVSAFERSSARAIECDMGMGYYYSKTGIE